MTGSLQVIARLLVDVGEDVQALTFFTPALKSIFTMMNLEFSITRDTACINAQLMKLLSTNFSVVAKECVVSNIVAAKRPFILWLNLPSYNLSMDSSTIPIIPVVESANT